MPLAANLTLRSFGLTLFLAGVGLGAGAPFVQTVSTAGPMFLALGTATVLAGFAMVMVIGQYAAGMSTDDLFGVLSGTAGNPAILAYANQAVKSDRLDIAFATVYPSDDPENPLRASGDEPAGRPVTPTPPSARTP